MAVVEIHPERVRGPWIEGFVLDRHVISSEPIGYLGENMQFKTTRTAVDELVYQLKNRGGPPDEIIDTATAFVTERWSGEIDCVVSPPPSVRRKRQPALLIAMGVARRLGVGTRLAAVVKETATRQLKNVTRHERSSLVRSAIQPGTESIRGMRILLVDDLWGTGSTMKRTAEVLSAQGASGIRALAMTRTK